MLVNSTVVVTTILLKQRQSARCTTSSLTELVFGASSTTSDNRKYHSVLPCASLFPPDSLRHRDLELDSALNYVSNSVQVFPNRPDHSPWTVACPLLRNLTIWTRSCLNVSGRRVGYVS